MYKIITSLVLLVFLITSTYAGICPLDDNVVCNSDIKQHKCVCAVPSNPENPVSEQSCSLVVDSNDEDFEGVSITFNLDESAAHKNFSQEDFRSEIAQSLQIDEDRIIILRIACQDDDEKLVVQFVALKEEKTLEKVSKEKDDLEKSDVDKSDDRESSKEDDSEHKHHEKNYDEDDLDEHKKFDKDSGDSEKKDDDSDEGESEEEFKPYEPKQLRDANKIVNDLRLKGRESQIADLDVAEIKVVSELVAIDSSFNNTLLLFEALAVVLGVILTCFLGCWFTCKKCRKQDEYLDTLQKV